MPGVSTKLPGLAAADGLHLWQHIDVDFTLVRASFCSYLTSLPYYATSIIEIAPRSL